VRKTSVYNEACMLKPRKNRVIVLEGLNFFWDEPELDEIATLWEEEFSMKYISDYFERDPDEVLLALIHLARNDKITQRRSGLLGYK
jgi:hypothetical protein